MHIDPATFTGTIDCNQSLRRMLRPVHAIITLKELNQLAHKSSDKPDIDVSIIKTPDLIQMFRQVKDHRGIEVYRNAEIDVGDISQTLVRNYQTFVQLPKLGSIYQLNNFFMDYGHSPSEAVFVRCMIGKKEYAAFYVPPIIEYQDKTKVEGPLARLKERAVKEPVVKLPGFDSNGDLKLQPLIEEWETILASSVRSLPILKDGTHRSYSATLAGTPVRAIIINETASKMQSVPINTKTVVITQEKPKAREDRLLGMRRIEPDRWEGWVDLASIGIDG